MKHEKNTTLGRKTATGLHKNEGLYKPKTAKNQMGDGADFAFNGQMGDGVNKSKDTHKHCYNPMSHLLKHDTDRINFGLDEKNRRGTAEDSIHDRHENIGPSVTRDPDRKTVSTAAGDHPVSSGMKHPHISNPDSIYMRKAER